MARRVMRGEIWTYAFARPDHERPVVVLTRDSVVSLLRNVTVAPITSTIHGIPSEVLVGVEEGLDRRSAVNLDNVQTVPKERLVRRVGRLDRHRMEEVCRALGVAVGCDPP